MSLGKDRGRASSTRFSKNSRVRRGLDKRWATSHKARVSDPAKRAALGRDLAAEFVTCVVFFSRLPVLRLGLATGRMPPFSAAVRVLPLAGLIIGCCGALPLLACRAVGLPPVICATIAVAALLAASGGLHEDGLADTADGLGGGTTRERKLAIMRDSRIGTYGVLAIVVALLLRVAAIDALLERSGPGAAAAAILASAAVSRALALLPLLLLPPARSDGLGRSVGRPSRAVARTCFGLAALIGVALPSGAGYGAVEIALACGAAVGAALAVVALARRFIGGHTGDIGGASQQTSEIGFLLALLITFP